MNYSDEEQQTKMINGRVVMNTLAFLEYKATEDELFHQIKASTKQQHKLVKRELKRILDYGISSGFLVRDGKNYSLPCFGNNLYQLDGSCVTDEESDDADDSEKGVDADDSENEDDADEFFGAFDEYFEDEADEPVVPLANPQAVVPAGQPAYILIGGPELPIGLFDPDFIRHLGPNLVFPNDPFVQGLIRLAARYMAERGVPRAKAPGA